MRYATPEPIIADAHDLRNIIHAAGTGKPGATSLTECSAFIGDFAARWQGHPSVNVWRNMLRQDLSVAQGDVRLREQRAQIDAAVAALPLGLSNRS